MNCKGNRVLSPLESESTQISMSSRDKRGEFADILNWMMDNVAVRDRYRLKEDLDLSSDTCESAVNWITELERIGLRYDNEEFIRTFLELLNKRISAKYCDHLKMLIRDFLEAQDSESSESDGDKDTSPPRKRARQERAPAAVCKKLSVERSAPEVLQIGPSSAKQSTARNSNSSKDETWKKIAKEILQHMNDTTRCRIGIIFNLSCNQTKDNVSFLRALQDKLDEGEEEWQRLENWCVTNDSMSPFTRLVKSYNEI